MSEVRLLGSGTVKENRIDGANQILESKDTLKKTERGTYILCCTRSVILISWNDNFECHVLSNCRQVEPIEKVQRWVKGKRQIQVSQSIVIKAYNEGIGGVDLMDGLLESYRQGATIKEMFIFVKMLNVGVREQRANLDSKMTYLA